MHHHSASWMQRLRNEDLSPTAAGPEWYNEWKWVGVEGEHGGGYEEEEGAFWFLKFKLNFVHVPSTSSEFFSLQKLCLSRLTYSFSIHEAFICSIYGCIFPPAYIVWLGSEYNLTRKYHLFTFYDGDRSFYCIVNMRDEANCLCAVRT